MRFRAVPALDDAVLSWIPASVLAVLPFRKGLTSKKAHEIHRLSSLVVHMCSAMDVATAVDVGAGAGSVDALIRLAAPAIRVRAAVHNCYDYYSISRLLLYYFNYRS